MYGTLVINYFDDLVKLVCEGNDLSDMELIIYFNNDKGILGKTIQRIRGFGRKKKSKRAKKPKQAKKTKKSKKP